MNRGRMEAFSDGVIAIIITIMVLELKVPQETSLAALRPLLPILSSYLLSFVFLGIYWSNHHHLLHLVGQVTGGILWANLHLLFWLSLVPFVTGWLGENPLSSITSAAYGAVLLGAALAYTILARVIARSQGHDSPVRRAFGNDGKGRISLAAYGLAIGLSFIHPTISIALYIAVALIWLVPDRRVERHLRQS